MRVLALALVLCFQAFAGIHIDLVQSDQGGVLTRKQVEKLLVVPDTLLRLRPEDKKPWLENSSALVEQEIHAQGYLTGTARVTLEVIDSSRNQALIHVQASWGVLYRFAPTRVQVDGLAPPLDTSKLAIHAGQPFQQDAISLALQQISEHYMSHGFLEVTCVPALDLDTSLHLVRTAFEVHPGRAVIFGGMAIDGLQLTRTDILRSLWNANLGDTIRPTTIRTFTQKLYQAKLFSNVRVTPTVHPTDSSSSLIRVNVRERVPGSVDGLVSWDAVYGAGLEGVIRHRNILGTLNELSLTGKLAQRDQLIQLGYGTPLLFGSDARMDYALSVEQQSAALSDSTAVRLLSIGNKGTFTYPIRNWITSWMTLTTARKSWYYTGGINRVDYSYSVELGQDLAIKNDPVDPSLGWSLSGQVGNGGEIGFDSTYWWMSAQSKTWLPLFGPFLTAFALDGGLFLNSTTLDGASRFWQGGGRSVRSYGYNKLRVETQANAPLRPRYVRASGELRVNLPLDLQVVWFDDWTRLWNEGKASHIFDKKGVPWGYGFGLRYKISLLSLRLDYALGRGSEKFTFDLSQAI